MNVLCIGDIVGKPGREAVETLLPDIVKENDIDFVIANVENAAGGSGIIPRLAESLLSAGCDVLTTGDHVWDKKEILEFLDDEKRILRPYNFPEGSPGRGAHVFTTKKGVKIAVINLLGRVFMRYNVNCPFKAFEELIEDVRKQTPNIIVDFHGEATSEKIAFGHFVDGKVSGVFGTHTHVQTADEKILSNKTAHITDIGMTGPFDSVIGQNKYKIVERFLKSMPSKFEVALDDVRLNGVIFSIDEKTGQSTNIVRVQRRL